MMASRGAGHAVLEAIPQCFELRYAGGLVVGRRFGRYRVEEELGRGDFGSTCRAVAVDEPGRSVVIKFPHAQLRDDELFIAMLQRECSLLDGLDHPGITPLLGIETQGGQLAVLRGWVLGSDMGRVIQQGRVPPEHVVGLLELCLRALAHANQRGVVHGDLSPSNIFWCQDGGVQITDFGTARAVHATVAARGGSAVGHPDYAAPELAEGRHGPRSDLYSLGLIIWECLVGRPACEPSDPAAKLDWHRYRGMSDPRTHVADCPDWLARLLLQLSAIDPATRPADAVKALALVRPGAAPTLSDGPRDGEITALSGIATSYQDSATTGLQPPPAPERTPPRPPRLERPELDDAFPAAGAFGQGGFGASLAGGQGADLPGVPRAAPVPQPGPEQAFPPSQEPAARPGPYHRKPAAPRAAPGEERDPKTERLKVVVFWAVAAAMVLVGTVAIIGYRTMQARRLAAARSTGPDIDHELLVGGGYDRFGDLVEETSSGGGRAAQPVQVEQGEAEATGSASGGRDDAAGSGERYLIGAADDQGSEYAAVSFSSNPIGARVWLDNSEIGHTPVEDLSLREGRHVIRLELDGYGWVSREIEVRRGEPQDLGSLSMEREVVAAGSVLLWSVELEGAPVFVDGSAGGRLPTVVEITPGLHDFFVQPAEGEPVELRLEAYPGTPEDPGRLQLERR
jgi:hypothetical protein